MKFLVDAQLPGRLAGWLIAQGHEALHTRDLPEWRLAGRYAGQPRRCCTTNTLNGADVAGARQARPCPRADREERACPLIAFLSSATNTLVSAK